MTKGGEREISAKGETDVLSVDEMERNGTKEVRKERKG